MNIESNDDTLKEILLEDEQEVQNGGRKKKGCLARFLIFMIILLIGFLGFIFIQQYLLDLEAEAIVIAARTATALEEPSTSKELDSIEEFGTAEVEATAAPESTQTPAEDPSFKHTATVSMQLTDVAAFQQTVTAEP